MSELFPVLVILGLLSVGFMLGVLTVGWLTSKQKTLHYHVGEVKNLIVNTNEAQLNQQGASDDG